MARHHRLVLVLWLMSLIGAALLNPMLEARLGLPDHTVRNSESARTQRLLSHHFPALGAEQDVLVFQSPDLRADDPRYRAAVERIITAVEDRPRVTTVLSPYTSPEDQISADRRTAVALIGLDGSESERSKAARELRDLVREHGTGAPVNIHLTGPSPLNNDLSEVELRDQERAEIIGVPIALLILLVALGSLVAALLPIAVALASVLLCTGVLALLATPLHLDRFATVIATVIGIGVGIDYALFVVSRFREELSLGSGDRDAATAAIGVALRTSGRTVVVSGLIVIVALGSMVIIDGHIFMEIALAAALVVICCLLSSLTLLPALLALLGRRVNAGSLTRRSRPARLVTGREGRWARWGRAVLRRPLLMGLPAFLLLVLMAVPTASIKPGFDLGLDSLTETSSGRGQRIVAEAFHPGVVGPVQVLVRTHGRELDLDRIAELSDALRDDHRVARVSSITTVLDERLGGHSRDHLRQARSAGEFRDVMDRLMVSEAGGDRAYLHVVLTHPVDSRQAGDLVGHLRGELLPRVFAGTGAEAGVAGLTAQYVDLAHETITKLPVVIGIVLLLSFCYLLVVFRSLLLPFKAVVLNLLATTAALGVTVLVFQYGYGEDLLGFHGVGTIQAYLPVALFALLFGLSMDYEIFLVSRVQEEWSRTGDNAGSVATALEHTARQITSGAAIMVAVFGSLMVADVLELKQFGFGLAFAVLIDATLVRVLLVPAAMAIASRANWWLPRPLAAVLPARGPHRVAPSPARLDDLSGTRRDALS